MNDFIKYLQRKGFVQSTQKYIIKTVQHLLATTNNEALNITKKDILKYLEHLKEQGKENTTINLYLRSLRYYFDYLLKNNLIPSNPTNFIKIRGVKRRKLYKIFTSQELMQLTDDYHAMFIQNFDERHIPENIRQYSSLSRQRNYCMLTFLVYQGLHTIELQKITINDIDLIKASIKIAGLPRTNSRTLPLKAEQISVLMYYTQNIRPQLLEHYTQETDRFFLLSSKPNYKRKTEEKHANAFNHLKTQLQSINAGFSNFKQIRSSVITGWIQIQGLRKAQYYAGHRYTSSTENYLPNNIEQLSDDIEKYNPF